MLDPEDGKCLYEVLGVAKAAPPAEVTRAWRRLALLLHPDKNPGAGGEDAARSFQALQRIYAVLGDAEKRAIYDETGSLQDAEDVFSGGGGGGGGRRSGADLYAHYRAAFRQVTEEDLLKFARDYRGSDEERADLLRHHARLEGDMPKVFEWVMLSRPGVDDRRFAAALDAAVAAGEQRRFPAYERWAARARVSQDPGGIDPLDPEADGKLEALQGGGGGGKKTGKNKRKKIGGAAAGAVGEEEGEGDEEDGGENGCGGGGGGGGMMSLVAQIRGRGAGAAGGGGFLAALEAKCAGHGDKGGGGGGGGREKKGAGGGGGGGGKKGGGGGGGAGAAAAAAAAAAEPTDAEFEAAAARLAQGKAQKEGPAAKAKRPAPRKR